MGHAFEDGAGQHTQVFELAQLQQELFTRANAVSLTGEPLFAGQSTGQAFTRDAAGWRETMVTVTDGRLSFALSAPAPIAALDHRLADTTPGEIVELCPDAAPIIDRQLARLIAADQMGTLFKACAIFSPRSLVVPGFED